MEATDINDRRMFERIPVQLSMRFVDTRSNDWNLVQTEDISAKGVGLVTDRSFDLYTPVEIWLPLVNRGESYYTRGQVVWSKPLDAQRYRIGIELDKTDFMGISQVLRAAGALRSVGETEELPYRLSS